MFARLGPWCHDHRKARPRAVGPGVLVLGGVPPAPSATRSATSSTCPTSSPRPGFDILDEHFGGQGTGIIGTIVFRAEQGVDDPAVAGSRCRRCSPRSPSSTDVDPGREPLRRGGRAADRVRGRRGGHDRLRQRRDARRHRLHPGRRDPRRDPRGRPRHRRACAIELGGFIFAEFEEPSSEVARPRLRHRHPDPRLRLGAGHGPAGRRRPVRHRHRHRASSRCSATCSRSPTSPRSSAS